MHIVQTDQANKDPVLIDLLCVSGTAEPSASPAKDNYRMNRYKNKALNPEEMRRRREEEGIQLRKQKREQQVPRNGQSRHSSGSFVVIVVVFFLSFCTCPYAFSLSKSSSRGETSTFSMKTKPCLRVLWWTPTSALLSR